MSSDGVGEDEPVMEGVQNDVLDLYRMVEELLRLGKKLVGQVKGVGKEVGQCGRRGQEMLAEAPVSGLAINIFLAIYMSVSVLIMFWWGRRVIAKFLDKLWYEVDGMKKEIRERGRNKSRSLPTVSPLVLAGGGLLNQNWKPLRGRQLAKSPEEVKGGQNPSIVTEVLVHGVVGGGEVLPPGGAGALLPDGGGVQLVVGADVQLPAGVNAPLPAGANAPLPAGANAPLPAGAGHLYENILSPIRPFHSVPNLVDEDDYLVPVRNPGNNLGVYSSDDDVNVTDHTYVSAMSLRSGRAVRPLKRVLKKRL